MQTPSSQQQQLQEQNSHFHHALDLHSPHNFHALGVDTGPSFNEDTPKQYQEELGDQYRDETLPQYRENSLQQFPGLNLVSLDTKTMNPMDSLGFNMF
jgi:hypothetical protein